VLVREGTESVGAEVDEGFHVVFCESAGGNFALVVHGVVVVFVVCPAGLADGLVCHLFSVLALFLLQLSGFAIFLLFQLPGFASFVLAGFRLAFGHGALLGGLPGAFVRRLAALLAIHRALLFLLAKTLLAWVLLVLLPLSIAVLVLLAVLIVALLLLVKALLLLLIALLLLVIALLVLLAVTLVLALLAIIVLAALLTVLLLLTVLRHSFGKLGLKY